MIIKLIWPGCEFQNGSWSNEPVDSYWVDDIAVESLEEIKKCIVL